MRGYQVPVDHIVPAPAPLLHQHLSVRLRSARPGKLKTGPRALVHLNHLNHKIFRDSPRWHILNHNSDGIVKRLHALYSTISTRYYRYPWLSYLLFAILMSNEPFLTKPWLTRQPEFVIQQAGWTNEQFNDSHTCDKEVGRKQWFVERGITVDHLRDRTLTLNCGLCIWFTTTHTTSAGHHCFSLGVYWTWKPVGFTGFGGEILVFQT